MLSNHELELAQQYVEFTNKNVFLTGKAGTGKTTFLHNLKKNSTKRTVVVAPTGVAAINAGGVTIHSFFQMPFGPHVPREALNHQEPSNPAGYTKISRTKINIIRSLDLLIIDEISMVRADLLDGIDEVLRRYRRTTKPFGGVQLLMIGDIQQLSPVVRDEDWQLLKNYYETLYFYGSRALLKTDYVSIELKHIFRQQDSHFIDILNKIRENQADAATLKKLNERYIPGFKMEEHDGYILLTTHNAKAREINDKRLAKLDSRSIVFKAAVIDDFPEYQYPTDKELELKIGAQVMFVKNDPNPEKRFYNGKIGQIEEIDEEDGMVYIKCPEDNDPIEVGKMEWENTRYTLHPETKEIEENVIGKFIQYPLKLAWAITIHKSQGLTFDKAIIDAQASFAHGQVYVALSRCRTLEGMVLSTPIGDSSIKTDSEVSQFNKAIENEQPDEERLKADREKYIRDLLLELFSFRVMDYPLRSAQKTIRENATSFISDQSLLLEQMQARFKTEIWKVGESFSLQLKGIMENPDPVQRAVLLNERLEKAAQYFIGKLDEIVFSELIKMSTETDNQKAKKQLKEALEQIFTEAHVKRACLNQCAMGFNLQSYLRERALAYIEKPVIRKASAQIPVSIENLKHPALFEELREWRNMLAQEHDVPAYRILQQKTLIAIAQKMPASVEALLAIKGIGKTKVSRFGSEILEIISDYCRVHNIDYQPDFNLEFEEKKKEKKPDTKLLSYELFKQGKNIQQIAQERALAITTIQSHLAHYVEQKQLDINQFLKIEELDEIQEVLNSMEEKKLTPLKEILKHKYDYGVLKMALAYHRSLGEEISD